MNKANKPKRPKKPDKLYTQDLLVKNKLLNIRINNGYIGGDRDRVNRCTRLAAEFGTAIFDIYNGYAARMTDAPKCGDARWKHLQNCLASAGKPAQVQRSRDFAEPLGIKENMISDSKLLHGERRASIDGVCHALLGLGMMKNLGKAAIVVEPKENKASERKDAVRRQKRRFASCRQRSGSEREHVHVIQSRKRLKPLMRLEPENKTIRETVMPFGYWLPGYADNRLRRELFESAQKTAHALAQKPLEKRKTEDGWNLPMPITPTLMDYICLSRQKIVTLRSADGAWSDNANKLHLIIACCDKRDGVDEIKKAYHAFGLHPHGLEDPPPNGYMFLTPDFPADQVVCASIVYFRDLIACIRLSDFAIRMSVFWGLLYAQLDYYDEDVFSSVKLNLRNELFFNLRMTDDSELKYYSEYFDETEFLPREE